MPNIGAQNVGYISAANAGANLVEFTGDLAAGATFTSRWLVATALNHYAFLVNHTDGVDSVLVQPQVALRRGAGNVLEWTNLAPAYLVAPGTTNLFTINTFVAQAIRALVTHTGGGGQPVVNVSIDLSASG
jgi:hypothetical protein